MRKLNADLLLVCEEFARKTGMRETILSRHLFADAKRIGVVRNGADLHVSTWERAMSWLSDNWPEGEPWPEGVQRYTAQQAAE